MSQVAEARAPKDPAEGEEILRVEGLVKHFPITKGFLRRKVGAVQAVDGVSFTVRRGETLGIVGESGCGKSTLARCILRLLEPTAGKVWFEGQEITSLDNNAMRELRRDMQIIFQDPYASLNPRMTVNDIIAEPMIVHGSARAARRGKISELIDRVGLNPEHGNRYPHEFSGGQRQRIGIARALALEPKLIICDEPVSALDVSIQAQIINLLEDLQAERHLTYVFIAHDLSVVRHISDDVLVMYLGKVVELAPQNAVYQSPMHPYSQALLSAVPIPDPSKEKQRQRVILRGDVPSPANPPPGCRFHTRCFRSEEVAAAGEQQVVTIGKVVHRQVAKVCVDVEPELEEHSPGQFAACHFAKHKTVV
ncbi:MAG: ABC transporter ATP-binding protein [Actinomycetota bacterium]|nr:dipeptide ABC transporter ATP-binding protein [Actinomycetota bacterium]